jgi:alkylation response protein AidB-like acyl-CoA dehydrogenase
MRKLGQPPAWTATKVKCDLPSETREVFERARQFAETSLAGRVRRTAFDRHGWAAAAESGVFQLVARAHKNTRARGALSTVAMLEGMGRGGADRGLLFAMGAHMFGCLAPLSLYAAPSQAAQWEGLLRDGTIICALAVTEQGGGSTMEHIETILTKVEGGYLLTGRKTLIGHAPEAGMFLVLAREFLERGPLGLTAVMVPAAAGGLQ